ncbi:serine/threonine-protein phosphatase [Ktedonobacteria bacterium brp13]|nr:serine/threonine-protein phosphatase [Ktedonobacteria bacterium brp13]
MSVDIGQFLQNVQVALANQQYPHAQFLVEYAIKIAKKEASSPMLLPLDVSIGLHRGRVRGENEDCVLALQGILPATQEAFGLFIVADGMGGHANGQEAAHIAIQSMLDYVFPFLVGDAFPSNCLSTLSESIHQANRAIYARNQSMESQLTGNSLAFPCSQGSMSTSQISRMGTTTTAVLLFREVAYVANVGDSRTYLYHQSLHALKKITQDHSLVAQLLADGFLQEEDIYRHPQRNQITRAVGVTPSVDVDTFVVPLYGDETLLLCSDGLWEMTRDRKIEEVLSSSCSNASLLANQFVQMANDGGGADNIGCIVVRLPQHNDVSAMETIRMEPLTAHESAVHTS